MTRLRLSPLILLALLPIAAHGQSTWPPVVESEPVLRLGYELEGAEEYLFSNPRAVIPVGDHLVLLEGAYGQVRIFDEDGSFVRNFGGIGRGPGEFIYAYRMSLRDSVLHITDPRQRRVTFFSLDGELLGTEPIPEVQGVRFESAVPLRGNWLAGGTQIHFGTQEGRRSDQAVVLARADGSVVDTLLVYPGGPIPWQSDRGFGFITVGPGAGGSWAVEGDSVVVAADGEHAVVHRWVVTGGGVADEESVQLPLEPEPFTSDDLEEVIERENRKRADAGGARLSRSAEIFPPEYWPQLGRLVLAGPEVAWVQRRLPGR